MTQLVASHAIQTFLDKIAGLDQPGGDARVKAIVRRIVADLFVTIDELDVSEDEFWHAVSFMAAAAPEFGLLAPGLGFEHFLDVRMDLADAKSGRTGGTPRTIEGPLYVAGAPREKGFARLDDGTDSGATLIMRGRVLNTNGKPIAGAVVDVWHANTKGNYSHFDKSQSLFNFRRRIVTDEQGGYKFRSVVPCGYAVPPGGSTEALLSRLGRHGRRPAHIHFFVSAPGYRHLTTQINIDGDPYLHDDFAYATRDNLIPAVTRQADPGAIRAERLHEPYQEIEFDFQLLIAERPGLEQPSSRSRAVRSA